MIPLRVKSNYKIVQAQDTAEMGRVGRLPFRNLDSGEWKKITFFWSNLDLWIKNRNRQY